MHKSRLAGFIIDCEGGDLEANARFWSEALGFPVRDHPPQTDDGKYVPLDASSMGLAVEVQVVDHPSRVHLDIESDDVEAEVLRLESLGARRLERVRDWWILEAPTGHRFCVIPSGRDGMGPGGREWP